MTAIWEWHRNTLSLNKADGQLDFEQTNDYLIPAPLSLQRVIARASFGGGFAVTGTGRIPMVLSGTLQMLVSVINTAGLEYVYNVRCPMALDEIGVIHDDGTYSLSGSLTMPWLIETDMVLRRSPTVPPADPLALEVSIFWEADGRGDGSGRISPAMTGVHTLDYLTSEPGL